ncbi:kallikrein-6 isoform X3 [Equus asinus]|uniref:Kallikrein related peptidase 6 n=1 Tax=Equus asinus TaxID=9793 RepID=A0A8C4PL82_EQUAS|nr:kallikrein-6 isoform X1 [Equus asinus]
MLSCRLARSLSWGHRGRHTTEGLMGRVPSLPVATCISDSLCLPVCQPVTPVAPFPDPGTPGLVDRRPPAGMGMKTLTIAVVLIVAAWAEEKNKVMHGGPCEQTSHPYQAVLYSSGHLLCGGVLIHPLWVLTAAHCKKTDLQVYLGKHNLQQRESFQEQSSVVRAVAHPGYNPATHDQDIMLLRLARPTRFSEHIQPLSLERDCSANHTSCHILGWGKTADGNYPDTIQCAYIHLVSREECERAYPGQITQNMVCAGDEKHGKDSCQGDSGGPLVCGDRLRGLVSWGNVPCGSKEKPGVYTDVCRYGHWIRKTIQAN